MKSWLSLLLAGAINSVFAASITESGVTTADISVASSIANKTVQLTVKSGYSEDIIITSISQYTNNGNACAVSNNQYAISPNKPLTIFPFSTKDQSNCFSEVQLFKRYTNGTYPSLVGFYDNNTTKFNDYLMEWGSYIITPVVFKISYNYKNITNQKGIVKYFIYKVSE